MVCCLSAALFPLDRFDIALQQNEIMDVFFDDWQALCQEDVISGSKTDTQLKEYQSFTDLKFSKEKTISYMNWHPTISGKTAPRCLQCTAGPGDLRLSLSAIGSCCLGFTGAEFKWKGSEVHKFGPFALGNSLGTRWLTV